MGSAAQSISIRLDRVSKHFGDVVALADTTLEVQPGELFFLLGPSGCGKSTLLRIIAGLLEPATGRVFFSSRDVTSLGTEKRNAVMVFQSYALWPHMTVRDNVAFGLSVRGMSRAEQDQRVNEMLRLVQMAQLAARRPNELSGGQQQRVALARALAVHPACLLLDEPLSNLDAKLRGEMRTEIRRICKTTGVTTVYVTHDQKEALSIADRIAVLNAGRLVQVGTPVELYHRPSSVFVAEFIGQTNLLPARVSSSAKADGQVHVETPAGNLIAEANGTVAPDQKLTASIRPEQIRIATNAPEAPSLNRLTGHVIESTFLGEASEHVLRVGKDQKLRFVSTPPLLTAPEELTVEFDAKDVILLTH
jgi:iron(III) transport system ATP-binding protein